MRAGFIGAGKAGFSLGKYFAEKGGSVTGYYSQNPQSSKAAAAFTDTKYYHTLQEIIQESDLLFLTVPDGSICEVYSEMILFNLEGKALVHCSGALDSTVFQGIESRGAEGYSVHPICAISDRLTGYQELSNTYFTVEGNGARKQELLDFLRSMGNPVEEIAAEEKSKYHAAAVFASNLTIALYDVAAELLGECGLSREFSEHALEALFLGNANSIVSRGSAAALTGPVERGDETTIRKHLEVLEQEKRELYCLASMRLTELAQRKHPERDYDTVRTILKKGAPGKE